MRSVDTNSWSLSPSFSSPLPNSLETFPGIMDINSSSSSSSSLIPPLPFTSSSSSLSEPVVTFAEVNDLNSSLSSSPLVEDDTSNNGSSSSKANSFSLFVLVSFSLLSMPLDCSR